MLGNWSFGDYYKREAIQWGWELLTERWGLPKEHLYATVFEDDQGDLGRDVEASECWLLTDIAPDHILYFGRKDNFWEMGDTGPCGPCSEIHLDRGLGFCDLREVPDHVCRVNGACQRFIELWNLVFIQYQRHADGVLDPLPAKHIDTGMGFERLVAVLQDAPSNYDTDLFAGLMARTQALLGHSDEERRENLVAYRVIADHARAAAFLIADGAMPGNVGRNYVLRMIIRRAARFGKGLGFTGPFLGQVAQVVIQEMSFFFAELGERHEHILRTITAEEKRFQRTLDTALTYLDEVLAELAAGDGTVIQGATVFDLYATYGLPLEITRDVAEERGYTVDGVGFKAASEAHRLSSGAGSIGAIDSAELGRYSDLMETLVSGGLLTREGVDHDPHSLTLETRVLAIAVEGEPVEVADPGAEVEVVLAATPFYVESGGQVSDTGVVSSCSDALESWRIQVTDVHTPLAGLIVHRAKVIDGRLRAGARSQVLVDTDRRRDIMRNHTATHLLHHELRRVLGDHVLQQGSLVAPDRLRFDFNHPAMLTQDELRTIEGNVSLAIQRNYPVAVGHTSLEDAKGRGAMALFGEKYGDVVRTIQIGDPPDPYSLELCGGTHVNGTAEIGSFRIVS
jgi:alanyl-tRNA synthetase